ncbi:MAG: DUF354 domain-containing protein [Bacteroidales bacterium]|nr:DUF354 domain-containing protein [Bacteroidales bacterium]
MGMKLLIDIGHPAHVHIMKHFAHEMEAKGHQVLFTCRQKEFIIQLLAAEGFRYVSFGRKYTTTWKKLWGMVKFDWKLLRVCLKFKPDMFLSAGSMYAAQVSALLHKPHIVFEDTYNMEQVRLYRPFTDLILTGDYAHPPISETKEFRMAGYNELAYLHPKRFTPDESVLDELGVKKGEKYVVVRFIAWQGTHDIGYSGMSRENMFRAVDVFSKWARVFISSETALPEALQPYALPTRPERIHHVMYFASLVFGESGTMSEEAAMLGTPAIQLDTKGAYYTRHLQQDYGLMRLFTTGEEDQQAAIAYGEKLLQDEALKEKWAEKRAAMLRDKIDVSAFLVYLVENYPESKRMLATDSRIQYRFK